MPRKAAIIAAALVALLVVLALILPVLVDTDALKAEISARLEHLFGRPVEITGPLTLRLLPSPELIAKDIHIGEVAKVDRLHLRLSMVRLLIGTVSVDSLILDHPVISLSSSPVDGNLPSPASPPPISTSTDVSASTKPVSSKKHGATDIRAIEINDGSVTWQAGKGRVDGINAHGILSGADGEKVTMSVGQGRDQSHLDVVGKLVHTPHGLGMDGTISGHSPLSLLFPISVDGQVSANPSELILSGLNIIAGPVHASGNIAVAFDKNPRVEVALNASSVDLDSWQPSPANPIPFILVAQPPSFSQSSSSPPVLAVPQTFSLPKNVFVNAAIGVDSLIHRGQIAHQIRLEATLDQGEVMVNRVGMELPGGGTVSVDGVLATPNGVPALDGHLRVDAQDFRAFLSWLGVAPDRVPNLRHFTAEGAVTAQNSEIVFGPVNLALDGSLASARATLHQNGNELSGAAGLNADVELTSRHLAISRVQAENVALAVRLADNSLIFRRAEAMVGGAAIRVSGALHGLSGPGAVLDGVVVSVQGPQRGHGGQDSLSMEAVLSGSLPHPSARVHGGMGGLTLTADVTGDDRNVDIPTLDARYGAMRLTGSARADLTGPRPMVTGTLMGNALNLGFGTLDSSVRSGALPPSGPHRFAAALPAPAALPMVLAALNTGTGGLFSHEPLNLSVLNALDARIAVRAESLSWQGWRLEQPQTNVVIENGIGSLDHLTGKLLDGDANASLRLSGKDVPQVSGNVVLTGVNLAKARAGHGSIQVTQGRMNAESRFTATGRSSADMAAHLDGDGRLAIRDGIVTGFDLPAVNVQLAHLENIGSLIGLAQAGLSGGSTRFSALNATFRAQNGIVTTQDARLDADGGYATGMATFDLPRWSVESRIDIRVAGGTSPPLGLRFEGPMDAPRKIIDINALQRYLVERGLGSALKGKGGLDALLGRSPAVNDQDQTERPPVTGKQILKDLLKGLGGR